MTAPEHDDQYPRITPYAPGEHDPEWPEGWGAEPTEATPLPAAPAQGDEAAVPAQPEEESQ